MVKHIIVRSEAEFLEAVQNAKMPSLIVWDDVHLSVYPVMEYKERLKQSRQIVEEYVKLRRRMLSFLKSQDTR